MSAVKASSTEGIITIIRHGESVHNVERDHPLPDPPLTEKGRSQVSQVKFKEAPDIVLISPMTRTLQTAMHIFGSRIVGPTSTIKVQVWPELREANDATCNQGVAKANLITRFPQFDFSNCREQWDYEPHTNEGAVARAECVRQELKQLGKAYKRILLVTHRCFIAFLVQGPRFLTGGKLLGANIKQQFMRTETGKSKETRNYRFANDSELEGNRFGVNIDTSEEQDFGPSLLLPQVTNIGNASSS